MSSKIDVPNYLQTFSLGFFHELEKIEPNTSGVKAYVDQLKRSRQREKLQKDALSVDEPMWDFYEYQEKSIEDKGQPIRIEDGISQIKEFPSQIEKARLKEPYSSEKMFKGEELLDMNASLTISNAKDAEVSSCDICSRPSPQSLMLSCSHRICLLCAAAAMIDSVRPLAVESRRMIERSGIRRFLQRGPERHRGTLKHLEPIYMRTETNNDPHVLRLSYPVLDGDWKPPLGVRKSSVLRDEALLGNKTLYGERSVVSKDRPLFGVPNFSLDSKAMEQVYAWPPDWYHSSRMKDEYFVNEDHYNWAKITKKKIYHEMGQEIPNMKGPEKQNTSSIMFQPGETGPMALLCRKCQLSTFLQPQMLQVAISVLFADQVLSPEHDLLGIHPIDFSDYMKIPKPDGSTRSPLQLGHHDAHIITNAMAYWDGLQPQTPCSSESSENLDEPPTPRFMAGMAIPSHFRPPAYRQSHRPSLDQISLRSLKKLPDVFQSEVNQYPLIHVPDSCERCSAEITPPPLLGLARPILFERKDDKSTRILSREAMLAMEHSLFYCQICVEYMCGRCARELHATRATATHKVVLVDQNSSVLPMASQSTLMRGRPRDQDITRHIERAPSDVTAVISSEEIKQPKRLPLQQEPRSVFSAAIIRQKPRAQEENPITTEGIPKDVPILTGEPSNVMMNTQTGTADIKKLSAKTQKSLLLNIRSGEPLTDSAAWERPTLSYSSFEQPSQQMIGDRSIQSSNLQSVKKLTPPEFSPSEFSPSEFSPSEFSPYEFSPSELSPSELSPSELSPYELSPSELGPRLLSPRHLSPRQLSPRQLSHRQLSPRRVTPRQVRPRQLSPRLLSPRLLSPRHLSPRHLSPSESEWNTSRVFSKHSSNREMEPSDESFYWPSSEHSDVLSSRYCTTPQPLNIASSPICMRDVEINQKSKPRFIMAVAHDAPIPEFLEKLESGSEISNHGGRDEILNQPFTESSARSSIESDVIRRLRGEGPGDISSDRRLSLDEHQHLLKSPMWAHIVGAGEEAWMGGGTARTITEIRNCGISVQAHVEEFPQEQPTITAYRCPQHPKVPVSFFCLECEAPCFCGCCCVDGHHMGHEVTTVHEAWEALKERKLRSEVQTKFEQLVEDSLRLEPAIHDIRKELINATGNAKENVEKSLTSLAEALQTSEKGLVGTMQDLLQKTKNRLDQHSHEVETALNLLNELSDGIHANSVTHDHAKLCQFYFEFNTLMDADLTATLSTTSYPEQFKPVGSYLQNELQFFNESTYTRLAALDQAADLIRDLPIGVDKYRTPEKGVQHAKLIEALKQLDALAVKFNQEHIPS